MLSYFLHCIRNFCFFFSSRRRHTRCALVTGVQTCALPICRREIAPFECERILSKPIERALFIRRRGLERSAFGGDDLALDLGRECRRRGEGGRNPDNQSRPGEERAAPEINSPNKRRPFRAPPAPRPEERRGGKEGVSTGRSRWWAESINKKQ